MREWVTRSFRAIYKGLLRREISGAPTHVAIIQDGNRRYAREQGDAPKEGHEAGAKTTERVLEWCAELGIEELTIYAFSTENFDRPPAEREHLYDLLAEKLSEFADSDRVHEEEVHIRVLGQTHRMPQRVQEAIDFAQRQTAEYDALTLNVAIAYGGRAALLDVTREVARDVATGELDPATVDVDTVESRLYHGSMREVDLIVRTGGDERTSNFLPWYANGNEAAAFFCTPYWPEFSKVDFLRAIRTYEAREASWRRTRTRRALALVRALGDEVQGRRVLDRLGETLPDGEQPVEEADSPAD
ncbi:MAG: polyprenyl diphosphate synthase [Halodesulfurarchaeum sp.]